MGRLSTFQCGSSEHIFYFLGNHFVVREAQLMMFLGVLGVLLVNTFSILCL